MPEWRITVVEEDRPSGTDPKAERTSFIVEADDRRDAIVLGRRRLVEMANGKTAPQRSVRATLVP
jgi:hypothetical protein